MPTSLSPVSTPTGTPVELWVRSIGLRHQGRFDEALGCVDAVLAHAPGLFPCRTDRALILAALGRYEEALDDFDLVLLQGGPSAEVSELRQEALATAIAECSRRLERDSHDVHSLSRRGNLHRLNGEHDNAIADFEAVLQRAPDHVETLIRLGNMLVGHDRHEEASACYRRIVATEPDNPVAWFNLGNCLQFQLRLEEAIAAYRQAIRIDSGFAEAWLEEAHCRLMLGDYIRGWPLHEWRWQTAQMKPHALETLQPLWLGQLDPRGKTLLVWAEQGLGDCIQFARFLPAAAAAAGHLVLRAPTCLHRLFASIDPRIRLIDETVPLPVHDLHCPMMSLPLALGLDVPPDPSCLKADPERIGHWRTRLGESATPRIGLVWAGRQYGLINRTRDIPLPVIAPLLDLPFRFVCLQPTPSPEESALLDGFPDLERPGARLTDFAETAALIENLDLVISADTAVAHLAATLAKPCWLLLRHAGEWRWLKDRTDSPWYPAMRIFRQETPGDWRSLVEKVEGALREAGAVRRNTG